MRAVTSSPSALSSYELTVGRKPFEGTAPLALVDQICRFHPPRVSALNAGIPVALSNLIMELLAKYPKDRPPTAGALRRRFAAIDPMGPVAPPPSKPELSLPATAPAKSEFPALVCKIALLIAAFWGIWQFGIPRQPGRLEIESPYTAIEGRRLVGQSPRGHHDDQSPARAAARKLSPVPSLSPLRGRPFGDRCPAFLRAARRSCGSSSAEPAVPVAATASAR